MAIYIQITVIPRSGRQEIKIEVKQDTAGLKCYLKQTPEAGKANQELIKFLAKQLHITQQQITIVTGKTGAANDAGIFSIRDGFFLCADNARY